MKKQELIKYLAAETNATQGMVECVLKELVSAIHVAVNKGEELAIPDLGKFGTSERAARKGRNPATGASIDIAAKRTPKFSAAKALKEAAAG